MSPLVTAALIGLFILGGMATNAWWGAQPPKYTRGQKRAYGLIALACWVALLILANTIL